MKIVLIGAGSRDFGRGQIADVLQSPVLRGRGAQLWLVDDAPAALERAVGFARAVGQHSGTDVVVAASGDRREALPEADFVVVAVARRRMELWEQDFRVPLALGFRQCLGENGGPGALFHALRSLELVVPIARDVEALCPNAMMLNFTNPEARVLHAVKTLTRVNAIGICHGIYAAMELIERALERPIGELEVVSAGMNHLYQVLAIRDRASGEELRPVAKRRMLEDDSLGAPPLFRKMLEVFDLMSYPSDDHIGEYLRYGAEHQGVRWPYGVESRALPLSAVPLSAGSEPDQPMAAYAAGERAIDASALAPSGEDTVSIIESMVTGKPRRLPAVNVINDAAYIENLPTDVIVEVPGTVDGEGVHAHEVGPLPEAIAALMRPQYAIHRLLTEAWRSRSRALLLQCLLLDPLVDSIAAAEELLTTMLELQGAFLGIYE